MKSPLLLALLVAPLVASDDNDCQNCYPGTNGPCKTSAGVCFSKVWNSCPTGASECNPTSPPGGADNPTCGKCYPGTSGPCQHTNNSVCFDRLSNGDCPSQTKECCPKGYEYDGYVCSRAAAHYTFDCGKYGYGTVDVVDGEMSFSVKLANMKELTTDPALSYHLHTIWERYDDYGTDSECGASFTGLHYDPTYKCGGASEARDLPECYGAAYDCRGINTDTCEVGDLSGKYGPLSIAADGTAYKSVSGDMEEAKPEHYVANNGIRDEGLFSSIVFHKSGGARVLCCQIVEHH